MLLVPVTIQICRLLSPEERTSLLQGGALKLIDDDSWRVRCMIAVKFRELLEIAGGKIGFDEFIQLLKDEEGEVRSAAVAHITGTYLETKE